MNIGSDTQEKLDPTNNFTSQSAQSIPQKLRDQYGLNIVTPPVDPQSIEQWYEDQVDGGRIFENEYVGKVAPIGVTKQQIEELNEFNQKAFNSHINQAYTDEVYQPYVDSFNTYESDINSYNQNLLKFFSEMDRNTVSTFDNNALDFTNAQLLAEGVPLNTYDHNLGVRNTSVRYSFTPQDFIGEMTIEDFEAIVNERTEAYIKGGEGQRRYEAVKEELESLELSVRERTGEIVGTVPDMERGAQRFVNPGVWLGKATGYTPPEGMDPIDWMPTPLEFMGTQLTSFKATMDYFFPDEIAQKREALQKELEYLEIFKDVDLLDDKDRKKAYEIRSILERKKLIEELAKDFLVLSREQYNDFMKSSGQRTEDVSDEEYDDYLEEVENQIFTKTATDPVMSQISLGLFGPNDGLPGFKLNLDDDVELNRKSRFSDSMSGLEIGGLEMIKSVNYAGTAMANFVTDQPLASLLISPPVAGTLSLIYGWDVEEANINALKFGEEIKLKQDRIRLDMTQMARTDKQLRTFGINSIAEGPSYSNKELAVYTKALEDNVFRSEQVPALESAPLSLSSMIVGLIAGRGNPRIAAAVSAAIMSTTSGATFYYETLLADEYQLGPQRFGHLSRGEKIWYAWKNGAWEFTGEYIGNYIMFRGLGMGKGIPGVSGSFNKYIAGYEGGVIKETGKRTFSQRLQQHAAGVAVAMGIGWYEEQAAEYITGWGQSLNRQAAETPDANRVFEFNWNQIDYNLAHEEASRDARVGRWMGLGMGGGGATISRTYAELQHSLDFTDFKGTYDEKARMGAYVQLMNSEGFGGGLGSAKWEKIQKLIKELGNVNLLQAGTSPTARQAEILKEINDLMEGINVEGWTQEGIINEFMKGNSGLAAIAIIQDHLNQHDFYLNISKDEQGRYRDSKGRFISVDKNSLWINYADNKTDKEKKEAAKRYKARLGQLTALKFMADHNMFILEPSEARDAEYYRNHSSDFNSNWREHEDGDFIDISINEDGSLDISEELREAMGEENVKKIEALLKADKTGKLKITVHKTFGSLEGVTGKKDSDGYYIGRKDGTQEMHILVGEDMTNEDISRVLVHEFGHYAFENLLSENPELVKSLVEDIIDMGAKNPKIQKIIDSIYYNVGRPLTEEEFNTSPLSLVQTYSEYLESHKEQQARTEASRDKELINAFMEAIATGKFVRKDVDGNIVIDENGFSLFDASGGFWEMLKAAAVRTNIPLGVLQDFSKEDSAIVLAAKYSMLIKSPRQVQAPGTFEGIDTEGMTEAELAQLAEIQEALKSMEDKMDKIREQERIDRIRAMDVEKLSPEELKEFVKTNENILKILQWQKRFIEEKDPKKKEAIGKEVHKIIDEIQGLESQRFRRGMKLQGEKLSDNFTIDDIVTMRELDEMENFQIAFLREGKDAISRSQVKTFSNKWKFVDYWRYVTKDGSISHKFSSWKVNGKPLDVNYTNRSLNTWKFKQPLRTYREWDREKELELREQRLALDEERSDLWRNNDLKLSYHFNYSAFEPEGADGTYDESGSKFEESLIENHEIAIANMQALIDSDITEDDLKAIRGRNTVIYDNKSLTQMSGLAKKVTFENEANRLNEETAEMGMAWQFLPHDSFGYEKRINDFRHASMEELEAASYKLEAIKQGKDELQGDPLLFENSQIEGLLLGRINSNKTNNRQKDLELSKDLKAAFTEIAYRYGGFPREAPITDEALQDFIDKNVIYTLLPYDPSGPQKVELEHISYLKNEEGEEIPVPHKIELFAGDGTTANQRYNKANPNYKQISSHSKGAVASKVRSAAVKNPGKVHVILYRRASDLNVFNSPAPFSAVMEYLLDVVKNNTGEKNEQGLVIGDKYITTQVLDAFNEVFAWYSENDYNSWEKWQTLLHNNLTTTANIDVNTLEIKNVQGLIEILEILSDPVVSNKLGFEGDPRQNFIGDIFGYKQDTKERKAPVGIKMWPERILDRNSLKKKFLDPGLKGTKKGDIVSLSAYKIPQDAGKFTSSLDTHKYAKMIGFDRRSKLGASALSQGYRYGFQLNVGDVYYTSLETTAKSKMLGKTDYADYEGKGEQFRGLLSSRMPGRIYTQGNSQWEKSEATAYGAIMQMLATKFADRFTGVFLLQQDVEKFKKSKVAESEDFEMAMDLMYGMVRTDIEALESRLELITFAMEEAGLTAEQVSDYLYAKHAEERNAFINQIRPELKSGSGMTNEEAQEILEELASPQMETVANLVYEVLENTRQTMFEGGLETKERIDAWKDMYNFYVPLSGRAYDEMEDSESFYPTGGAGMAIYGSTTKGAKGRPSKTGVNLIANVIMQNAMVQQRARKDQAMLTLYNLVKNNPNEKVWDVFSAKKPKVKIDDSGNLVGMSTFEMKADRHMVPIRINGEQHFIYFKKTEYADALNGMTQEKIAGVLKIMSGPMNFMRGAFTQYNPAFFIGNFFRDLNGAVYNVLSELERDGGILQGYDINSKDFTKALMKQSFVTLKILLNEAAFDRNMTPEMRELVDEWEAAGGRTGFSYSDSINDVIENLRKGAETKTGVRSIAEYAWSKPGQFFDYVASINEAFENAIRLAAYIEARKAGVSKKVAAQLSKNITVNFNKSGEWGPSLNQVYLFFNASVQGMTRYGRTFASNKAELPDNPDEKKSWRDRITSPQKLAAGVVLLSALQTLINMALSGRDDDDELYYNKIADYKKERGFLIMTGEKSYFGIPMGYGYNLFNNLGTMLAEVAAGEREFDDAMMFMALSAHSSFSPISMGHSGTLTEEVIKGATPTVAKPPMDAFAWNRTYFGGMVKREQYPWGAEVPEATLSFRSPDFLQDGMISLQEMTRPGHRITGGIDINPDPYYYIAQSYWGGAGDFVTESVGLAKAGLAATYRKIDILSQSRNDDEFVNNLLSSKDSDLPTIKISDVPILKTIYGGPSRFYDFDLFERNRQEVKELDVVITKGRGMPSDPNMIGVQKLADELKQTEKMLDLLRDAKKQVRELPYIERTNAAYELQEAERKEVMRFNALYYKYRGQHLDPKPQGIIPLNDIRKAIGTDE